MIYFISACAAGWTLFPATGRCYKYYPLKKLWPDARDFCAREAPGGGGDLVSIPDQATNDFIASLSVINATNNDFTDIINTSASPS